MVCSVFATPPCLFLLFDVYWPPSLLLASVPMISGYFPVQACVLNKLLSKVIEEPIIFKKTDKD